MVRKLFLALALVMLTATVSYAGPSTPGFYRLYDSTDNLYVRSNPGGFVIGTLFGKNTPSISGKTISDGFYLKSTDGGGGLYVWGYAHGNADRCGWIDGGYLNPTRESGHTEPTCSQPKFVGSGQESRDHLLRYYAAEVNDCYPGPCTGDPGKRVGVVGPNQPYRLYGNYSSTYGLRSEYVGISITSATILDWRYVTKDGRAVLVKVQNGPWGFIARAALPASLPHTN